MRTPRPSHRLLLAATLVVALTTAARAGAATTTFGSPLEHAPNVAGGCESKPMVSWNDFDTYEPVASGQPSCTWWQTGVFGVDPTTDASKGYVPGDGTITSVTVRSGANPAPIRVTVARQLTAFGPNAPLSGPVCCTFAGQSDELRPAPNTTTTFALDLPVEHHRDLQAGIQTDDIVGISAAAGAGTLPLYAIPGQTRQSAYTQAGTLDAVGMWPALGTQSGDTGGGRSGSGFAGFEVTARFTWCDGAGTRSRLLTRARCDGAGGGATGGGAGGAGVGAAGPGATPAPVPGTAPALGVRLAAPRQTLATVRRRGALRTRCTLDAAGTCRVSATVTAAAARRLGLRPRKGARTIRIAAATAKLKAPGTKTLDARLTRAARTALRRHPRSTLRIRVTSTGSATGRAPATSAATVVVGP